jgi:hypothetical protein
MEIELKMTIVEEKRFNISLEGDKESNLILENEIQGIMEVKGFTIV